MTVTDTDSPAAEDTRVLETYRYLRGGMAVMLLLLAVAVLIEFADANEWRTSISSYYHSPARSVFVASLCALGILLIAYRGSCDSEDQLLNCAGFMAFIVAFVPILESSDNSDGTAIDPAVSNNTLALSVTAAVTVGVWWVIAGKKGSGRSRCSAGGWLGRAFTVVALAVVGFCGYRGRYGDGAHLPAAIFLFVAITIVVFISARFARRSTNKDQKKYWRMYLAVGVYMVLSFLGVLGAGMVNPDWRHGMLVVEILLIAGFAAYWVAQTVQLWCVRSALELASNEDRADIKKQVPASGLAEEVEVICKLPPGERVSRLL